MSLLQRRYGRITLAALTVAGLGFSIPLINASADPSPTTACLDAGNVWVHVEVDDNVRGGCASAFGSGIEALTSAGFDVDLNDSGFVDAIDGKPSPKGQEDWWAYAHTDVGSNTWKFYEVGGTQSKPVAGSIEAWRLMHTYSQDVSSLPLTSPGALLGNVDLPATPSPTASVEPSGTEMPMPMPMTTASPQTRPTPALPTTGN